jgi:hypothetical protein
VEEVASSLGSLIRTLIPGRKVNLNLPRPHFLIPSPRGLGFQHMKLERTNIQTVAVELGFALSNSPLFGKLLVEF